MRKQWFQRSVALLAFTGASALLLSAQNMPMQNFRTPLPGTVNYVEGQASIDGTPLSTQQNGSSMLRANQILSTGNGRVELLLSPGVFLRAGNNSEVRMVSPDLADPTVEVVRGEAMVEVDQKLKDVRVDVLEHGATATILKNGLYRFNGDQGQMAVIDGKLKVSDNGKAKEIGQGKEVRINGAQLKTASFDRKAEETEDNLYRWSSVRSGYLAEANEATAQNVYLGYGPYWGAGWYWNPYFTAWSWLPGDGFFYSPFGYPFFSPAYVGYAGYFGRGGFGHGFRGGFAGRGGFAAGSGVGLARAGGGFGGGGFHGGGGAGRR